MKFNFNNKEKMKKLVAILFFGLCAQVGFSQTYQFKTVNFSVSQKTEKGLFIMGNSHSAFYFVVLDNDTNKYNLERFSVNRAYIVHGLSIVDEFKLQKNGCIVKNEFYPK